MCKFKWQLLILTFIYILKSYCVGFKKLQSRKARYLILLYFSNSFWPIADIDIFKSLLCGYYEQNIKNFG